MYKTILLLCLAICGLSCKKQARQYLEGEYTGVLEKTGDNPFVDTSATIVITDEKKTGVRITSSYFLSYTMRVKAGFMGYHNHGYTETDSIYMQRKIDVLEIYHQDENYSIYRFVGTKIE